MSSVFKCLMIIEATGFEPTTSASRTQRSTKLSHASLLCTSYYRASGAICQDEN